MSLKLQALLVAFLFVGVNGLECPTRSVRGFPGFHTAPCYLYERFETQYVTAERMCRLSGGHLASISDGFVNAFVAHGGNEAFLIMEVEDFWIGGENLEDQQKWEWVDGQKWGYTRWDKDQPNNDTLNRCTAMKLIDGKWTSKNCFDRKPYVCALDYVQNGTTDFPSTKNWFTTSSPFKTESWMTTLEQLATTIITNEPSTQEVSTVLSTERTTVLTTQEASTILTTQEASTLPPSTESPIVTTQEPSTQEASTPQSSTQAPTTILSKEKTTQEVSTSQPSTELPSTSQLSTESSILTTQEPSTQEASTPQSSTQAPTTILSKEKTTQEASTLLTTQEASTLPPSTELPTTILTTQEPSTQEPTTIVTTQPPTTIITTTEEVEMVPVCLDDWLFIDEDEGGDDQCYNVYPSSGWEADKEFCESQDASLISIHDTPKYLKSTKGKVDLTIGLKEDISDGLRKWTWVDKSPLDYQNWLVQPEPAHSTDKLRCATYFTDILSYDPKFGKWKVVNCDTIQARVVCQKEATMVPEFLVLHKKNKKNGKKLDPRKH